MDGRTVFSRNLQGGGNWYSEVVESILEGSQYSSKTDRTTEWFPDRFCEALGLRPYNWKTVFSRNQKQQKWILRACVKPAISNNNPITTVWASMRRQSYFKKLRKGKIFRQGNPVYTGP